MKDMQLIRNLVGEIESQDIRSVDYYITEDFGIFIPSVGFCEYAIKPNHTHPSYSFAVFLNDSNIISEANVKPDQEHYLGAMLSPNIPHQENKGDSFTRYIAIFISRKLYETIYLSYSDKLDLYESWQTFFIPKNIMTFINRFMAEFDDKQIGYEKIMEALTITITHDLIRYSMNMDNMISTGKQSANSQIIMDYIQQHFAEKISLDRLAEMTNMSEANFIRKFKKETGITPIHYLIQTRLNKAKKFIRSGVMNVTEISVYCGFNSTAHLTSCFKKHFGITPSQYRELYKQEN